MKQQDFWKWAENQSAEQGRGAAKGKLDLSELPPDLRLSVPRIQELHGSLDQALKGIDLVLTDNRRRMVSIKKEGKRHRFRLHHMFVGCDEEILAALVELAQVGSDVEAARETIKEYIDRNRDEISFEVEPDELEAVGEHHDLQPMLDKWRKRLGEEGLAEVVITWGRYGRGQRTIRFGSYDFDRKLIRVHPALDQKWVPEYFVEFIVYHELLHAVHPPKKESSRRVVHTDEFRAMEERFPRFEEAMDWERANLFRFLTG